MKYGYARVSTDGQSIEAQVRQLAEAGCKKVFREVASGAKTERAQLRRLLAIIDAGDVVTVTRLDRLARSTRDLLNTLAAVTDKKAGFRSLGDTWADTTTSHGRLMLAVLGGVAEFERDLIRARTGEGRARAVANGVKLGRKPKLTPHQQNEARLTGPLANAVYVGRPSIWGNPFVIGRDGTRAQVIAKYEAWIAQQPDLKARLHELRGKNLVCVKQRGSGTRNQRPIGTHTGG
jgi:hypothetical protein